jgi:alanyl-tRNA synthetase
MDTKRKYCRNRTRSNEEVVMVKSFDVIAHAFLHHTNDDNFLKLLTDISGGEANVGAQVGRLRVAASVGYIDSRFMVFMKETYGYPLSMTAMRAAEDDLKVDYAGLRYELERIGKKEETIESELKEIRYFCKVKEEMKANG